jgi:exopolysaccharide production negative regulator
MIGAGTLMTLGRLHSGLVAPIRAPTVARAIAVLTLGLAIIVGSTIQLGSGRRQFSACGPEPRDVLESMHAQKYAAEQGNVVAQWKLARMYATGDGVSRCDLRAFEYFSLIANSHVDDDPHAPQVPFVASAFVALGEYYLSGIPKSSVKADGNRARALFTYAALYFHNADAQYQVGRMYLDGHSVPPDARQAARWFMLAADKGQHRAQAMLGYMLVKGDAIPQDIAGGLMWLTLAREGAETKDKWINEFHDRALEQTNEDDRARALVYLERWLTKPRD